MKYRDVESRKKWEMAFRRFNPDAKQMYYMAEDVERRQDFIELKISEYKDAGKRLNKRMRNYLKSKKNVLRKIG